MMLSPLTGGLALPETVLEAWAHAAPAAPQPVTVFPDGCQDLVLCQRPGHPPEWRIAVLTDGPYRVWPEPGELVQGLRLHPGSAFAYPRLLAALQQRRCESLAEGLDLLASCTARDPDCADALAVLADSRTVREAAGRLGLSPRTLERLTLAHTGRVPQWWRQLARARRAAAALRGTSSLAAIAADHGYADQSHFQRACLQWFGMTPGQLRRRPQDAAAATLAGYGTLGADPAAAQLSA